MESTIGPIRPTPDASLTVSSNTKTIDVTKTALYVAIGLLVPLLVVLVGIVAWLFTERNRRVTRTAQQENFERSQNELLVNSKLPVRGPPPRAPPQRVPIRQPARPVARPPPAAQQRAVRFQEEARTTRAATPTHNPRRPTPRSSGPPEAQPALGESEGSPPPPNASSRQDAASVGTTRSFTPSDDDDGPRPGEPFSLTKAHSVEDGPPPASNGASLNDMFSSDADGADDGFKPPLG